MRILFMATPAFAEPVLNALIHSKEHQLIAVYTQPPRAKGRGKQPVKSAIHQMAEQYHIEVKCPVSLKDPQVQGEFRDFHADIAIVMAYGLLLPDPILKAPNYGCVNIHPSRLPRFRGASPMQYTILEGDRETSLMIIQMDHGMDTGDILLQEDMVLGSRMTYLALHDMMSTKSVDMVAALLRAVESDSLKPRPQSTKGIVLAPKIEKQMGAIDWQDSAIMIDRKIRALNPSPGVYFFYKGTRIKILDADVTQLTGKPGMVLDDRLAIACNEDAIIPIRLQRDGKQSLLTSDFLRGFPIPKGTILPCLDTQS